MSKYTRKEVVWSEDLIGQPVQNIHSGKRGIVRSGHVMVNTFGGFLNSYSTIVGVAWLRLRGGSLREEICHCSLADLRFEEPKQQSVVREIRKKRVYIDIPVEIEYGGRVYVLKEKIW